MAVEHLPMQYSHSITVVPTSNHYCSELISINTHKSKEVFTEIRVSTFLGTCLVLRGEESGLSKKPSLFFGGGKRERSSNSPSGRRIFYQGKNRRILR